MPGGRPKKFQTEEERAEARRERVRLNVRAYRQRKGVQAKAAAAPVVVENTFDDVQFVQRFAHPDDYLAVYDDNGTVAGTELMQSKAAAHIIDMAAVSDKPRIELYFGTLPAIVEDLELATPLYPWKQAFSQLQTSDRVLDLSMLAGGARLVSSMRNFKDLADFSRVAYQEAVKKMQLRVDNFDPKDAILLAQSMVGLANFEIGEGSTRSKGSTWEMHAKGALRMMQAVGPEGFQSELGLKFMRPMRFMAVSIAMWDPSANFMQTEEWSTVPYAIHGKTKEDKLWDYVFNTPTHQQLIQRLHAEISQGYCEETRVTAWTLWEELSVHRQGMEDWLFDYCSESITPMVWTEPTAKWFSEGLPPLFKDCFYFPGIWEANSIIAVWTTLTHIYFQATSAQSVLVAAGYPEEAALFSCFLDLDPETNAYNVFRSMEFCLGPNERDLRGAICCCQVPFHSAMRFFRSDEKRYEKELEWGVLLSDRIARRMLLRGKPQEAITDYFRLKIDEEKLKSWR